MADIDADNPLPSLQAAACTYRNALGPRAGQKVLSLRTVPGRDEKTTAGLCADAHGFSLHAGVRCGGHQGKELERLCRYITSPAIAVERQLRRNSDVSCGSTAGIPHGPLYCDSIFLVANGRYPEIWKPSASGKIRPEAVIRCYIPF